MKSYFYFPWRNLVITYKKRRNLICQRKSKKGFNQQFK